MATEQLDNKAKETQTVLPAEESVETSDFEQSSQMSWEKYQVDNPDLPGGGFTSTEEVVDKPVIPFEEDMETSPQDQDDVMEFIEGGDEAVNQFYQNSQEGQMIMQKRAENKKKMNEMDLADQAKKLEKHLTGETDLPTAALKLSGAPMGYWMGKVAFTTVHDLLRSTTQFATDTANFGIEAVEGLTNWVNEQERSFGEKAYGIKNEGGDVNLGRLTRPEGDLIPEDWRTPSVEFASNLTEFLLPMIGVSVATGGLGAAGSLGAGATRTKKALALSKQLGKEAGLAGGVAMIVLNPDEDNAANFFQKFDWLRNPIFEGLARDEDDSKMEARLKNAVLEAGIDIPFGLAVRGAMAAFKAIKFRGSVQTQLVKEQFENKGIEQFDDLLDNMDFSASETQSTSQMSKAKLREVLDKEGIETVDKTRIEKPKLAASQTEAELAFNQDLSAIRNGGMVGDTLVRWQTFEDTFKKIGASNEQGQKMLELGSWRERYRVQSKELMEELNQTYRDMSDALDEIVKKPDDFVPGASRDLSDRRDAVAETIYGQGDRLGNLDNDNVKLIDGFFDDIEKNGIINPNHKALQLDPPSIVGSFFAHAMRSKAGFANFGFLKGIRKLLDKQKFLSFDDMKISRDVDSIINDPDVKPFADDPTTASQKSDYAMNEMPPEGFKRQGGSPAIVGPKEERKKWWIAPWKRSGRAQEEIANKALPRGEFESQINVIRSSAVDYINKSPVWNISANQASEIFNKVADKYHALGWRLPEGQLPTVSSDDYINLLDAWLDPLAKEGIDNPLKQFEMAVDKTFKTQMPVRGLAEDFVTVKDLQDRTVSALPEGQPVKLSQVESHPLTSQNIGQMEGLMAELENLKIAKLRKDPAQLNYWKGQVRDRIANLDKAHKTLQQPLDTTAGRILKSKDVDSYYTPPKKPGEKKKLYNRRFIKSVIGEGDSVDGKMDAIVSAYEKGQLNMNAINRAGVTYRERIKGPLGKINDWMKTVQTLVGLRMLSAVGTKYVVAKGLALINAPIKLGEEILQDIVFDPMVRGLRTSKGIDQIGGSRSLMRLMAWKQEMGDASKNVWKYLSFQKNSVELDFSPKGSADDMRYEMTKGESPLQHFREYGNNWIDARATNKTMKGLRYLFNRSMQAYQLIGGIRVIKSMDIFNRNMNMAPALHNVLRDQLNKENVNRFKNNVRPWSKAQLEKKLMDNYDKVLKDARNGDGSKLPAIIEAQDETARMSFMSRHVTIAGTENVNIGEVTRKITNQMENIPMFGKLISLFRHVMLNVGDFTSRRSPLFFANPSVRKSWGQGRQSQVLAEAVGGVAIASGNYALFMRGKEIFRPKDKQERQALRQATGMSAYGPLIRDPESGKQYVLDSGDPVGALTAYYMELYDVIDDLTETKDFGKFFGDFMKHHLKHFTPYQFIEKYAILSAMGGELSKTKKDYKVSKFLKNGLHAGIIKEWDKFKSGFHPQEDVAQMEGELDEDYKRAETEFPLRWRRLMRKAAPMWGDERDIGEPQTDFLGYDIQLNEPTPRQGFSIVSSKDYYDLSKDRSLGKKISDYGNIVRKKLPVRNEPLVAELWKLVDSPSRGKHWDQQPLQLYADYKYTLKDVLSQEAYNEAITSRVIDKYFAIENVNQQQLWDRLYHKNFIINDVGVRNINKLAGGMHSVKLGDRVTTGSNEIKRYMSNFSSVITDFEEFDKAMNSPAMQKNQQRAMVWAMNFDKYGHDMRTALERLVFNPQEGRIKMEFESRIQGADLTLVEKKQILNEVMRKRYKPYGYKSRGLSEALAVKIDETDGKYVFNKVIHDHLSIEEKEQSQSLQRGIVNEVAKNYTSFAKWTYLQEKLFGDKKFNDNLLKEAIRDFEDSTEGSTKTPLGEDIIFQGVGE